METDTPSEAFSDSSLPPADSDHRIYFVPYRWWKDADDSLSGESGGSGKKKGILYAVSPTTSYGGSKKLINKILNSEFEFKLRKTEGAVQDAETGEVGVSCHDFALVSGEMWRQAWKWYVDTKGSQKEINIFSAAEDDFSSVYPLQTRLTMFRGLNYLAVRVCKKDNGTEYFQRACKIFDVDTELMRIWDFSDQINLFFSSDTNRFLNDSPRLTDQEVQLELQIYGLPDFVKCKEEDKGSQHCNGSSRFMNGSGFDGLFDPVCFFKSFGEDGSSGLTGLQNLGNTCFMNSALQCLAHTPKLVDYFLGDYAKEINHENTLGKNGEIALAFGELLRKLWEPGATPLAPRTLIMKLSQFAPQFSGYSQHDSQELLACLLDGLHEDLNRIKCKPYVEAKDADNKPDEEVANECWRYHLARNNSIIVDTCQGQFKSTLVCPLCKKVSITFSPFMYLSLPLPSSTTRSLTVTIVSPNGITKPSPCTITVPKNGNFEDLIQALSNACSLGINEDLLITEVYNNRIIRVLGNSSDSLTFIRDEDWLVAYRLAKDSEDTPLIVFTHQNEERYIPGSFSAPHKGVGIPLVSRVGSSVYGSDIRNIFLGLLSQFQKHSEDASSNDAAGESTSVEVYTSTSTEEASSSNSYEEVDPSASNLFDLDSESEFQFYTTDERGIVRQSRIEMDMPVAGTSGCFFVIVGWSEKLIKKHALFNSLLETSKIGCIAERPQETTSLYKCLDAFLTEEPLGPKDMWLCPRCKEYRQASKKLDLWRLPEILIIHLKRFSYNCYERNKLETFVDFPIDDLDLSEYIASKNIHESSRYKLYAISNHYGGMGFGHYTAFVNHGGDQWYDFNDSFVHPISVENIKTSAAYLLFYKRV